MPDKPHERELTDEEIKAIKGRMNYIEVHIRNAKAQVICTLKVKVDVLQYKFIWGCNRFLVKPYMGDKTIWKDWKQLKSYKEEKELLSS